MDTEIKTVLEGWRLPVDYTRKPDSVDLPKVVADQLSKITGVNFDGYQLSLKSYRSSITNVLCGALFMDSIFAFYHFSKSEKVSDVPRQAGRVEPVDGEQSCSYDITIQPINGVSTISTDKQCYVTKLLSDGSNIKFTTEKTHTELVLSNAQFFDIETMLKSLFICFPAPVKEGIKVE